MPPWNDGGGDRDPAASGEEIAWPEVDALRVSLSSSSRSGVGLFVLGSIFCSNQSSSMATSKCTIIFPLRRDMTLSAATNSPFPGITVIFQLISSADPASHSDPATLKIELTCERDLAREFPPLSLLRTRSDVEVGRPRSDLSVSSRS